MNALQPGQAHQTFNPAMTDPQPAAQDQFGMDAPNAVGSAGELVKLTDRVDQRSIVDIAN